MVEGLSTYIATKAAEEASKGLIQSLVGLPKKVYKRIEFQVEKGLPKYLQTQSFKCENSKTLLSRDSSVYLPKTYVEPEFRFKDAIVSGRDILRWPTKSDAGIIVSGLAGCGKSAFLRMSFLNSIQEGVTYYPIFFELRRLNSEEFKDKGLVEAVVQDISRSVEGFEIDTFRFGLKNGSFYFFLDGYDELNYNIRDRISEEIEELVAVHNNCSFMMTSRPSEDLDSWSTFEACHLEPFSKEKVKEFVTKTPFEEEDKCVFLKEIEEGLFEKYSEFLSNPLLALMMLLIFSSRGEIPKKKHLFYQKCFEVLTIEHDAKKGRYKRKLFSDIEMDDLERIFKFFCVLSYRKRMFSFTRDDALEFCNSAIKATNLEVPVDRRNILRDFQESISILSREGDQYDFIHRSFQEYYYAKFVVEDRSLSPAKKLDRTFNIFAMDEVFNMARDINAAYVEDEFLIPAFSDLHRRLSKLDPDEKPDAVLRNFFVECKVIKSQDEEFNLAFSIPGIMKEFRLWNLAMDELDLEKKFLFEDMSKAEELFPEGIKIHHMNRDKLIKAGAPAMAKMAIQAVSDMLAYLKTRSEQRSDPVLDAFED